MARGTLARNGWSGNQAAKHGGQKVCSGFHVSCLEVRTLEAMRTRASFVISSLCEMRILMSRGVAYLSLVVFVALGGLAYKERRALLLMQNEQAIRENIYEAIIRHHYHQKIATGGAPTVMFLSFAEDGTDLDPPDRFIARLRDLPIDIAKVSAHVKDKYGAVKDMQGRSGVIIRLYGIGKQGIFKRVAGVSFYYWGWGQEGDLFHLELTDSGWRVTQVELTSIT
jgi:hypothetical protein